MIWYRPVLLLAAFVCLVFATFSGVIWHVGDTNVNLYYAASALVVLAFVVLPQRRRSP